MVFCHFVKYKIRYKFEFKIDKNLEFLFDSGICIASIQT